MMKSTLAGAALMLCTAAFAQKGASNTNTSQFAGTDPVLMTVDNRP